MSTTVNDPKPGDLQISPNSNSLSNCTKCRQLIHEPHLLLADQRLWHEDCLRCMCCDARLAELDKIFYMKAQMPLCRRDYLRLYGRTGECEVCQKRVQAFEFVMKVHGRNYHLNCFCCQRCQLRFCVGDRFYVFDNKILCEYDYTEVLLSVETMVNENRFIAACVNPSMVCLTKNPGQLSEDQRLISNVLHKPDFIPLSSNHSRKFDSDSTNHDQKSKYLASPLLSPRIMTCDDHSSGYGSPTSPSHVLL